MDDPIFDPWCLGDDARPTPPQRSSRWRGAAKGEGVPAQRPLPSPRRPPRAKEDEELVAEWSPDDAPEESLPETPERALGESVADDLRPAKLRAVAAFRALIVPRVNALNTRLAAARHRSMIDDRLDHDPPSLRLRIEPWSAPFDSREGTEATVLELVIPRGQSATVIGRVWLDPSSSAPSEERHLPAEQLSGGWIDGILYEFVETALSRD